VTTEEIINELYKILEIVSNEEVYDNIESLIGELESE